MREPDDHWADKIALLLADPVAVASFHVRHPAGDTVAAPCAGRAPSSCRPSPNADEAKLAEAAGVDLLAVQAASAGGHSGTLTPQRLPVDLPLVELLAQVRAAVALPLAAAGGLATPEAVTEALAAGAAAVMVGTVLLRPTRAGPPSHTGPALADPARGDNRGHARLHRPARGGRCATASPSATATSPRPATPRCTT